MLYINLFYHPTCQVNAMGNLSIYWSTNGGVETAWGAQMMKFASIKLKLYIHHALAWMHKHGLTDHRSNII